MSNETSTEAVSSSPVKRGADGYAVEDVVDLETGEVRRVYRRQSRSGRARRYAHVTRFDVAVAPGTKPIYLYLRLSKYHRDGSDAIERQRIDLLRQLAAEGCWTVVGEYIDNDSASSYGSRARRGYDQLKVDVEAGVVGALAFWKLDRVDRVATGNMIFIASCLDRGVTLRSHEDPAKELNEIGGAARVMRGLKALLGEMETDTDSARQLAAKAHTAENGFFHGGTRPFGWQPGAKVTLADGRSGRPLLPHHVEFPAIADAVRMAAFEGRSTADIGEHWRDKFGLVGADGEPMFQGTVHRTLTSPRLLGYRTQNKPEGFDGDPMTYVVRHRVDVVGVCACVGCTDDRSRPRTEPGVVFHRAGDPLVVMKPVCDLATWQIVQEELRARDKRASRRSSAKYGSKVYLLPGFLFCGECGGRLSPQPRPLAGGTVGVRYVCKSRTNRGKSVCPGLSVGGAGVETWVEEFVLTYLDDGKLEEARRLRDQEARDRTGEDSLQTQLAEARRVKAEIESLRESGKSYQGVEGLRDYRKEVDRMNGTIERLSVELDAYAAAAPRIELTSNLELRELWAGLDVARKRVVFEQVFAKIVVARASRKGGNFDPERLTATLKF